MNDVQLNFETADEIFGCSQGQNRSQFDNVGTEGLVMEKNITLTESDVPIEHTLEVFLQIQLLNISYKGI